jgi:hypothetical protein
MGRMRLRAGDLVEVRSADEILQTLDERGELERLPFMPEMIRFCGQRLRVEARAERVCDRVRGGENSVRFPDTLLLEDQRCDGSGHAGCQADCRLLWKEAWLKPVADDAPVSARTADRGSTAALAERASRNTTAPGIGSAPRYRCQATQGAEASVPVALKDPVPYLRVYQARNVSLRHFVRVMWRALILESKRKLGRLPAIEVHGTETTSIRLPTMGLQPGDWVRVKMREEIEATLNDKGKNRGLFFDREELAFCNNVYQVRNRITRFIDERTGELIELNSDCVSLDGAYCSGENSLGRWFCPRAIYGYWREAWLDRADQPTAT